MIILSKEQGFLLKYKKKSANAPELLEARALLCGNDNQTPDPHIDEERNVTLSVDASNWQNTLHDSLLCISEYTTDGINHLYNNLPYISDKEIMFNMAGAGVIMLMTSVMPDPESGISRETLIESMRGVIVIGAITLLIRHVEIPLDAA